MDLCSQIRLYSQPDDDEFFDGLERVSSKML